MRPRSIYAVYKGEEFLDVGTIPELAERLNVIINTVVFWTSKKYHQRIGDNAKKAYKLEGEK